MQTFLPYPDFRRSSAALDDKRLGKQRVETYQILRALTWPKYAWKNHPAVRMWRGFVPGLVAYGLANCDEWTTRGYADTVRESLLAFSGGEEPDVGRLRTRGQLPPWLGLEPLHVSHRSALVRKDPAHYRELFPDVPDDLPYLWPPDSFPRWPVRRGSADGLPVEAALRLLGLAEPRTGQAETAEAAADGRDVLVTMRPGHGGSTAGLLAGLVTPGRTLWVSPGHGGSDLDDGRDDGPEGGPEDGAPAPPVDAPGAAPAAPEERIPAAVAGEVDAEGTRVGYGGGRATGDGAALSGDAAGTTPGGGRHVSAGGSPDEEPPTAAQTARPPSAADLAAMAAETSAAEFAFLAPDRLDDAEVVAALAEDPPGLLVVDDAHRLTVEERTAVRIAAERLGDPAVVTLTGAADGPARTALTEALDLHPPVHTGGGFDRPAVHLAARVVGSEPARRQALAEVVRDGTRPALVLAATRERAERLAAALERAGLRAAAAAPGMRTSRVADAVGRYRTRRLDALVVPADGEPDLGRSPVRLLVHADPPADADVLHAQLALAGRRGEPATAVVLATRTEVAVLAADPDGARRDLAAYLDDPACRRAVLLDRYGEPAADPCGRCDRCATRAPGTPGP